MRTIAQGAAIILLLMFPCVTEPQEVTANSTKLADRGHIDGLTYTNGSLGMSYRFPEGFFASSHSDTLPGGTPLLAVADRHNGTPWRDRIVLIADDAARYSWTTKEYATRYVHAKPAKLRIVILRETYRVEVDGHEFFRVDYKKTEEGKTMYEAFVCTRRKDSFVGWTFVSLDQKSVEQMAGSINTVSFR